MSHYLVEVTTRTEARETLIEWADSLLSDAVADPRCPQYSTDPAGAEKLIADALSLCLFEDGTQEPREVKLFKEAADTAILRRKVLSSIQLSKECPDLFR